MKAQSVGGTGVGWLNFIEGYTGFIYLPYDLVFVYYKLMYFYISDMITDVQLAAFANILGVSLFLLVVLYHFVAVNNPKRKDE